MASNVVTDVVLAAVAAPLGLRLLLRTDDAAYWGLVLLFTAISALLGAAFHATNDQRLWLPTLLLTTPIGFFLVMAASPDWIALAALKQGVALWLAVRTRSFAVTAADSGISLLLVAFLAGSGWIVAGTALALAGVVMQLKKVRGGPHLDHNDVFHLVQAAAAVLFYLGAS